MNKEDEARLRLKAIGLFGHLSQDTIFILKNQCYSQIVRHLGEHRDKTLPILKEHINELPPAFIYRWALYVGDRKLMRDALIKTKDLKFLCYWAKYIGDKKLIEKAISNSIKMSSGKSNLVSLWITNIMQCFKKMVCK